MESLVIMETLFNNIYKDKVVLVTAIQDLKDWLSLWLKELGAMLLICSEPPTEPNHFELLKLEMITIIDDIRNREKLNDTLNKYKPDIVFHMAAQPIVRILILILYIFRNKYSRYCKCI